MVWGLEDVTTHTGTCPEIGGAVQVDNEHKNGVTGEIVVDVSPPPWTLTVTPERVQVPAGSATRPTVVVAWTAPAGQTTERDLIAIFPLGEIGKTQGSQGVKLTGGAASGTLDFVAPPWGGLYEVRYYRDYDLQTPKATALLTVDGTPFSPPTIPIVSKPLPPRPSGPLPVKRIGGSLHQQQP